MSQDRRTPATTPTAQADDEAQIPLVLSATLLFYLGQQTLNPVIAPLARECGLAEWQVGLTIGSAAAMVALTSRYWGRRAQSWGRRPVLLLAMAAGTVWMALFAGTAHLGSTGAIGGTMLFAAFLLTRGIGFGGAMAAVPPTVQAYVVDVTHDEPSRVRAIAGIGAVQGLAGLLGAAAGGLLAALGILAPLVVVPVLLGIGTVLLAVRMRRDTPAALVGAPTHVRVRDARVWPYLLAGFGIFLAMGSIQVTLGFLVQDRLALTAETTGVHTGAMLLLSGGGMFIVQTLVVPRCGWSPPRLLKFGTLLATAGCAALVPERGLLLLCVGMLLFGTGLGFALPGCTAGPTMLVERREQGGLAGLVGAVNGLTFVIAPVASTALYGVGHTVPLLAATALMAFVAVFVARHPRFRSNPAPAATIHP